ncbi:MAG: M15 family metallopeptidase, partial [Treponema sp.]|nr:M15 family metallopeptidase [Treponema sp.]
TPPQEIIDIFASEGFIWGGTWAVWDNMHFEYHPELIINSQDVS